MTKALLQQARDALLPHKSTVLRQYTKVDAAIDALNAELAKPEPSEPVLPKAGILYIGFNGEEVRGYTAKELNAAVLQERENCIAICDALMAENQRLLSWNLLGDVKRRLHHGKQAGTLDCKNAIRNQGETK